MGSNTFYMIFIDQNKNLGMERASQSKLPKIMVIAPLLSQVRLFLSI